MANSLVVKVTTCFVVMCMVLAISLGDAAISCDRVKLTVAPCVGYLRNPGPFVTAPCCDGVKAVNNQATTTPDRRSVCSCLKTVELGALNLPALASLPGKCGVNLSYKPSPSVDCSTII